MRILKSNMNNAIATERFLTGVQKGQRFVWKGEKKKKLGFLSGYEKHETRSVNGSSVLRPITITVLLILLMRAVNRNLKVRQGVS